MGQGKASLGWPRRIVDVVVASTSLVLLTPLFLLIALAIKLDSRGPVLYRQSRVGSGEIPFQILKFRSMVSEADRIGPKISGTTDPRVTRVGHFLRATKLDEFPQFWNVVRGDMTLVGPRAEVPEMIRHYTPEEREVLKVKPGLTGVGQLHFTTEQAKWLDSADDVEQFYIDHQLHDKLAIDLEYLRDRSWRKDLGVLWQTVKVVLLPRTHGKTSDREGE